MRAGELAHIFFSFEMSCETTLADKLYFMPVFEVDMAAPCPCIGVRILLHNADEGLVAMRILYSVPLPVFHISFHTATVVIVARHSKRKPQAVVARNSQGPGLIPTAQTRADLSFSPLCLEHPLEKIADADRARDPSAQATG